MTQTNNKAFKEIVQGVIYKIIRVGKRHAFSLLVSESRSQR